MAGMSYAPTANYNGPATLTILTSDLGNTGAGGPLTDTDTVNITVNAVNDAPAGTDTHGHHARGHAPTPSPPRTSASPTRTMPGQHLLAVKITTLPAAGTLTDNSVAVTAGQFVAAPTSPPACSSSPRRPTPTAPATRASPSRCRTTAAPPTAGSTRPDAQHHHHQRHQRQRCAGGHRQDGHHARGHRLHLHRGRLRLHRPERQPGQQPAGGQDHHPAAAGTLTDNGVAVTAGQFVTRGRHHWPAARVHPGGQRQRRRLRQLHLPGAGQRRHRQRRGGPRPDRRTRSPSTSPASTMRRRAPTRRSPRWRTPPTPSPRPTSASAIRTIPRPTACWRSRSPRCRPPARSPTTAWR